MAACTNENSANSEIASWYNGRSVLITGGTGFMGKVLVEKLLRSCPGLKTIYLLIRPKKGQDPKQRISQLVELPLFDHLRKTKSDTLNKLVPISGDITQPDLGISSTDRQLLVENISVVFHSAATVKFDEALRLSVEMNIIGTKRLLQLCKQMQHLKAFIHVSTAYCNCDETEIAEKIYPSKNDPEKIIQSIEHLEDDLLEGLTPKIIGQKPNTYTFTKALAEQILVENCGSLPVAIVRPSIVTAALHEPVPGWVDNLNGPTGLFIGGGKGILRTLLCYRNLKADMVPVDIAINLLIAVAWDTANNRNNKLMIYNCTSGNSNPVKWGDIENWGRKYVLKHPLNNVIWYPGGSFKSSRLVNNICIKLYHTLPAYIMDFIAIISGRKPIMVKIHDKMQKAVKCLEYFTTHEWVFHNDNIVNLYSKLNNEDKNVFNFNIKTVKWENYIEQYILGTKQYILKEDLSTIPDAKQHLLRMYYVHRVSQVLIMYMFWRLLVSRSSTAQDISNSSFDLAYRLCVNLKNSILTRIQSYF